MSRQVPMDRPLSDEDREYLHARGQHAQVEYIDQLHPAGEESADSEEEGDDYDEWKVTELQQEVDRLNGEGADITVTGTGRNGSVTKPDLIKALREYSSR